MLAKLTTKNQLTLPKAAIEAVGAMDYFEVETRDGVIVLTPVRIQRGDAIRTKLAQLALSESDIEAAVGWARGRVAESRVDYENKKTAQVPSTRNPKKRKP